MQIKRVDLLGFKSFSDKASLDFRQRITCVVGPNGCGKSNIVDALRWTMGEQSARHLRGKSMEDVIFNGSDSRGPSGMAEASITFENDGLVPIEYLDYSEITVTRRLHRDGTSEYLINRVPVRLRDVTNLFLGTGVGTKAYSIIEQGRIGLIVSARPEERRHFIDEAAGITKYQRRKVAAERKMEATEQNLLRVRDVLDEMGKRLGSLRRQAKKAERYKEYRAEMREIELWSSTHRLLEIIAEEKLHGGALIELEDSKEEAQLELRRREVDVEAARLSALEEERKVSALQEELYALDNRVKLDETNIQFHGKEADELEQRARDARVEMDELGRQLAEADVQIASTREEHARWERGIAARRTLLAEREALHARQRAEGAEVHRALEEERRGVAEAERRVAQTEAMLRALSERERELEERAARTREEAERVAGRIEELRASAGEMGDSLGGLRENLAEIARRRDEARAKLEGHGEEARRGEAEIDVLRTELHRRRSRLASLKEIQERYEGFSRGTRAVMQKLDGEARERGVLGLVADMLEAPAAFETALEAVLGQRLGTIIVENDRVGLEAIEFLKTSAEGRSSFINRWSRRGSLLERAPVGTVWADGKMTVGSAAGGRAGEPRGPAAVTGSGVKGPILRLVGYNRDLRAVAESLLGDVVVVDTLENALAVWEQVEGETLVTLDGEILGPDGSLTGGSQEAELGGVLRAKREIKELGEIIADLEVRFQESLDAHVALKAEMAALDQTVEQLTREGHQADKDLLAREKDLGRVESESAALVRRSRELEAEIASAGEQRERIAGERTRLLEGADRAARDVRLCGDIAELLVLAEARAAGLIEGASAAVTDTRVELAEEEAGFRAAEERLARLEELRKDRQDRIARLESIRVEGLARTTELRAHVEELQVELRELVTKQARLKDRLAEGRATYEERLTAAGEIEARLKEVRALVESLGADLTRAQVRVSELAMAKGHLEDQIWERHRERLSRVAGDYHLRPPVTEKELERLSQLRQIIERMGEINLTAIEEFGELDARHSFLTKHKEDLESALGQLQRAIQKINRTSRKRFQETFDLVNAKFQEVFPRLFRGGRAKLVLTDEENLLESGVEIVAQPPGKRLQSIELLSGGEKALTAVSLIFSMFLVKPTPFCLLDEVDAPLDEANVVRFNEMVREMSDNSQFIIITHNRRTMEIGDRLYGVTMEDPGISKLVSVNLTDFESPGRHRSAA
jgi:chromosome segregation protein